MDEAEIITIAVDPSERGRGIADRLMREAIRRQQAERVRTIFLEVDETNQPAVNLYKKLGFRITDQRAGYYSSETLREGKPPDALVMRLDLG
jgi:ribosomal-protein-alanine N-acetyltransferase